MILYAGMKELRKVIHTLLAYFIYKDEKNFFIAITFKVPQQRQCHSNHRFPSFYKEKVPNLCQLKKINKFFFETSLHD